MTIALREITRDNWRAVIALQVAPDQTRWVASNLYSLAESKFVPECVPLAIYDDETLVGFIMYRSEDHGLARLWSIDRLMIGQDHQRKGYGRAAMHALIQRLRAQRGYAAILISFVPDNTTAEKLYRDLGFRDTGMIDDGEVVYRLGLMG